MPGSTGREKDVFGAGPGDPRRALRLSRIQPGSPWENGYNESFNGTLRDQYLNGEIFYTLREAKVLLENWRYHYNHERPHSSLNYRPPAPEAQSMDTSLLEVASPETLT